MTDTQLRPGDRITATLEGRYVATLDSESLLVVVAEKDGNEQSVALGLSAYTIEKHTPEVQVGDEWSTETWDGSLFTVLVTGEGYVITQDEADSSFVGKAVPKDEADLRNMLLRNVGSQFTLTSRQGKEVIA